MNIKVEWTGEYPNLCSGKWIITIENKVLNLPGAIMNHAMNTYGEFLSWSFGDDYKEEWDSYSDGLEFNEWIRDNVGWIKPALESAGLIDSITIDDLHNLYNKIQALDWRHNSYGGCI